VIGKYCEIAPGARILGHCFVGDFTMVGAGAVLLPSVKIGANVTIGAGAVVTKDIPDNSVSVGVPARVVKRQTILNLQ
jgi:serine acetyltransferase